MRKIKIMKMKERRRPVTDDEKPETNQSNTENNDQAARERPESKFD